MPDVPLGRLCWHELLTPDPEAALPFYRDVLGWTTEEWAGDGAPPYTMWVSDGAPLGGVMRLPDEAAEAGAPAHWLTYVSTHDIDATVENAEGLGAEVLARVDVPTVGRMSVFKDPQGAVLAAFQPEGETPGHDGPAGIGQFSRHELATKDWRAAWDFYAALFGWRKAGAIEMDDVGTYQLFGRGAQPLGGLFDRPQEFEASFWLPYVRVSSVATALTEVRRLGGRVLNGPEEVPSGDVIAQCMDPQGAAIALHQSERG